MNMGGLTGPPDWERLKFETVSTWSWVLWDLDPRKTALARPSNNWKLQIRPTIKVGAQHQQTSSCLKTVCVSPSTYIYIYIYIYIYKHKKKTGPRSQVGAWHWDRLTGWLTVWCNLTLTLTLTREYSWNSSVVNSRRLVWDGHKPGSQNSASLEEQAVSCEGECGSRGHWRRHSGLRSSVCATVNCSVCVWIGDSAIVTGSYGVGSRYQTSGQDTADWEDSVRAVVNCSLWISDSAIVIWSYDL
jgi:hypothetical protein